MVDQNLTALKESFLSAEACWTDVRQEWLDAVAADFERSYWAAVEEAAYSLFAAAEALDSALADAEREW